MNFAVISRCGNMSTPTKTDNTRWMWLLMIIIWDFYKRRRTRHENNVDRRSFATFIECQLYKNKFVGPTRSSRSKILDRCDYKKSEAKYFSSIVFS